MMLPSASLTLTPRGSEGGQTGACSSDASGSNHSLDCRLVHVRGKVGGMWRAFATRPRPRTSLRVVWFVGWSQAWVHPWRRGGLDPHSPAGRRRRGCPLTGLAPSSWPSRRGRAGDCESPPIKLGGLGLHSSVAASRYHASVPGSRLPALIPPGGGNGRLRVGRG